MADYERYSRQLIVPEIGLSGLQAIQNAKILVVGAGGLGCPALAYLAGAGVGTLGIVDGDYVEASNLHRQIIHDESTVGMLKCYSAEKYLRRLNHEVQLKSYPEYLTPSNAFKILEPYDIILDCTDGPVSRYLVNDVAVILGKPIVFASALKGEAQLSVFHWRDGPCYRCLYPQSPPLNNSTTCSESGILGPVVGLAGTLQAVEAIKLIVQKKSFVEWNPSMTLYSAFSFPMFRTITIRKRQTDCAICGETPSISRADIENGSFSYEEWCAMSSEDCVHLDEEFRLDPKQCEGFEQIIDVRKPVEFDICKLSPSINLPLRTILHAQTLEDLVPCGLDPLKPALVVCKHGKDSQVALSKLLKLGMKDVKDLRGGLVAWRNDVDPSLNKY